jgi:hypothetical protein
MHRGLGAACCRIHVSGCASHRIARSDGKAQANHRDGHQLLNHYRSSVWNPERQ